MTPRSFRDWAIYALAMSTLSALLLLPWPR